MTAQVSTRAFREFVPEIREMIYAYCLRDPEYDYDGRQKTPALLAALRGDSELYTEALHYYYSNNITVVHHQNFKKLKALNSASWRSMRRLSIFLPHSDRYDFCDFLEDWDSKLQLAENIETFGLELARSESPFQACNLVARCARNSTKLRSVEVIITSVYSSHIEDKMYLIDGINSAFANATGKLNIVDTGTFAEEWIWKADDGDLLELSQEGRLRGAFQC